MSYVERLRKQGLHEFSYEPKSFWEYSRGNNIDKLVEDIQSYDHNKVKQEDFLKAGRGSFLSKFNSEYAKRIIEMWSKEGDTIVDPFAGRSSRPLVSTLLKRNYIGFDVVNENLKEAKEQYLKLQENRKLGTLTLHNDTSDHMTKYLHADEADMIMTCPPYFNIEKYESADGQLTDIKSYEEFFKIYNRILQRCIHILKDGGFFVVVLANFRIDGKLYDFCGDTKAAIKRGEGMEFHDEIILEMSPAKRHPLYTQAITNLNCLKTHEYCIVFRKPDTPEKLVERNNDINWNRPLVKDIHPGKERLFWVDKKDWINDQFVDTTSTIERFF